MSYLVAFDGEELSAAALERAAESASAIIVHGSAIQGLIPKT
jgi:hypothetical protein